jgi:surfeit locus 1 family protein
MSAFRRRDWILIIILVIASLICVRLGFWQLARLQQRMDRNASIKDQLDASIKPFSLSENDYQRVSLEGEFLHVHEILLQNRSLDEVAGFHVITPLRLEDGTVVLVDRGWIAYEAGANFALENYQITENVRIEGVLLPGQSQPRWRFLSDPIPEPGEPPLKTWRVIDIDGMQRQMPFTLHHQYISLVRVEPIAKPQPEPDFQPDLSNGPHLSYAIQWFSFAAIAIIGGAIMLRRSRSQGQG